jgi:hypothetical protein
MVGRVVDRAVLILSGAGYMAESGVTATCAFSLSTGERQKSPSRQRARGMIPAARG